MRKPSFDIVPEGAAAIGICAFSALIFAILDLWLAALIFWLMTLFSVQFFRDPSRVAPQKSGEAASPADGKVVAITARNDPFTGEPCQMLSIFMNIFSVHVNRAPVNCEVKEIKYIAGAFFNASLDKASEKNERCLWHVVDDAGENWTIIQIAGLVARRIVCWAEPGDSLKIGGKLGMIRFGSRVDLYVPNSYSINVSLNSRVYAGETVIATKK